MSGGSAASSSRPTTERTLHIHYEDGAGEQDFVLEVPSPDVQSADLVACVRARLALPPDTSLYFTREPRVATAAGGVVVPLVASLPDGSQLRAVARAQVASLPPEEQLPTLRARDATPGAGHGLPGGVASPGARPGVPSSCTDCVGEERQRRCADRFCEGGQLPPLKEIATDLANERTLLAWIRTVLAVIRTVFSYATLGGLTHGWLVGDIFLTVLLSFTAVWGLLVGWQRFVTVRSLGVLHPTTRRISVAPIFGVLLFIAGLSCIATLIRSPLKLRGVVEDASEELSLGSGPWRALMPLVGRQ